MNKQELIKELAARTSLAKSDVALIVETLPEVIKDGVIEDGKVNLTGFVTFEKKHVSEKSGVTKLKGIERPWKTEAHDEVKASLNKNFKLI